MSGPEIDEVPDDRADYRRFTVTVGERRFSVLHTPDRGQHQPAQTLVSNQRGDDLWSTSNILALDGHVSALACANMIERAYTMAGLSRALGYQKRGAEIRAALGVA